MQLNHLARTNDANILVIDYGSGNLRSVQNALAEIGGRSLVSNNPREISQADAIIIPGVGAGTTAMQAIRDKHLVDPIKDFARSGRPVLGICLGLQILMDSTTEGDTSCLGIIPGKVYHLPINVKVPHMGWNSVEFIKTHPVFKDLPTSPYFYFVHSYYVDPTDSGVVVGSTDYGIPFCSALVKDNIIATQFHPEKSGELGLTIYKNFIEYILANNGKSSQ